MSGIADDTDEKLGDAIGQRPVVIVQEAEE